MPSITVEQALELANSYFQTGEIAAAETLWRQVVTLQPHQPLALHRLGVLALERGLHEEALQYFTKAVAQRPDDPSYHSDLGVTYRRMGRLEEAVVCYERALALNPNLAFIVFNLGLVYYKLGRCEQAIACYRRALLLDPKNASTHLNLAISLLMSGQFTEGWKEYEWRWHSLSFTSPARNFTAPQWNGNPAPGQTILLHTEQGFGDAIQFLRYLPVAIERAGARQMILECQPELVRLIAQNGGKIELVGRKNWGSADLPSFDRHLPLLSLPFALGLPDPQPPNLASEPYLTAHHDLRACWRERLGPRSALRVGLAWSGRPENEANPLRSLQAEAFLPLLEVHGVSFYRLQKDSPPESLLRLSERGLVDHTPYLTDFAETAALMAELDLIITTDTVIPHLAGALGRPVWTLLHFVPDWRWGLEGEVTPWYPTMRLFRQKTAGEWEPVIRLVVAKLEHLSKAIFR